MSEKLRILVVDDSRVVQKAFDRILSDSYELVEATNGEDAWDILTTNDEICAVFTDLNMPHLDGYGLLRRIRSAEDPSLKQLPVILVTAADDNADTTKEALTAGATDYVLKPFDSIFLKSKAKAHVKPRQKVVVDDKLATVDPLTRLANATYFVERGQQEISAANRHNSELALLLITIDRFKELTELMDDRLLKGLIRKLGTYLSSEVRLEDTVARVEKDQFAIIAPGTGLHTAIELAGRLRQRVRRKIIRHKEHSLTLTISVGVSALPCDVNRSFEMLMTDAQRHLRSAIVAGGDAVISAKTASGADYSEMADTTTLSLNEAIARLNRRGEKMTPAQATEVFKQIVPLLEYCDQVLQLRLDDPLAAIKQCLQALDK